MELGQILLVGGTGYLGSHLAVALDLDIIPSSRIIEQSKLLKFDAIIHAAHFKDLAAEKNFIASLDDDCYFVFFSSAAVYGETSLEGASPDDEAKPINDYGSYKLELENLVKNKFSKYLILRISNPYGKENRPGGVYQIFKSKIASAEPLPIFADKAELVIRDFIYIDQWLEQVLVLLENKAAGVFNISSGQGQSLESFAANIQPGLEPKFDYLGSRAGDIKVSVLKPV